MREYATYELNEESFGKIVRVLCGHYASHKTALIIILTQLYRGKMIVRIYAEQVKQVSMPNQ